jgi:hypothetical protein
VPRHAPSATRASSARDVKSNPVARVCASAGTKPALSPLDTTISALPTTALADGRTHRRTDRGSAGRSPRARCLPEHEEVVADLLIAPSSTGAFSSHPTTLPSAIISSHRSVLSRSSRRSKSTSPTPRLRTPEWLSRPRLEHPISVARWPAPDPGPPGCSLTPITNPTRSAGVEARIVLASMRAPKQKHFLDPLLCHNDQSFRTDGFTSGSAGRVTGNSNVGARIESTQPCLSGAKARQPFPGASHQSPRRVANRRSRMPAPQRAHLL